MANNETDSSKRRTGSQGVFDISKPGSAHIPASPNSRPVMITNRPVIKDPMVNEVAVEDPKPEPKQQPTKKIVITPLHDNIVPEDKIVVSDVVTVEPVVPVIEKPETKPDVADEVVPELPKMLNPIMPAGVPVLKDEKQLTPEQAEAAAKAAQERAAKVRQAIEKEQYFLPINAIEEQRSRRVAILGLLLIIVLAVAWYDIALDAGLLTNMYELPHTHFFTVK